jgi:hypothetical protein
MVELTKDDRIRKEILRIKKLLRELPEDKLKVADGIIKRLAFMQITLEDLEEDIKEHGIVENFCQTKGIEYDRERPTVRVYNNLIKNYSSAFKQIADLLPQQEGAKKKDQLMEFLKK